MLKLTVPPALKQEFATVEALWHSVAETRRVDSLILSWVKYEKQLRRLFCFLVFQHPTIASAKIDSVIGVLAKNNKLYPETFIRGIAALGVTPVPALVGPEHQQLEIEIARIKKYRNKIMHGQATGLSIQSVQLERDVRYIIKWIEALAVGADTAFGYDGLRRNTFKAAKANSNIAVSAFPFNTEAAFGTWLRAI